MDTDSLVVVLNQSDMGTARAILELQRAAYAVEASLIDSDAIPPLHESEEEVAALDLTILAVVEAGVPVAMLGYNRVRNVVEIDRLAVHPKSFRRGLARLLLTELHRRECSAAVFDVSTGRDNRPARDLYRSLGYREAGDVTLPEGITITRLQRVVKI